MNLVKVPNKILERECVNVPAKDIFEGRMRDVSEGMFRVMRENKGIGLSGPQVGLPIKIFVTERLSTNGIWWRPAKVVINPLLVDESNKKETMPEGCLSIPGIELPIERPSWITVCYNNLSGDLIEERLDGLFARVWLHEWDHLRGILITDLVR